MAPAVDGNSLGDRHASAMAPPSRSYAAGEAGATTGVPTAGAGVAVLLLQPANARAKIAAANSTPSFFTRMSVFPPVGVPWASEPGTRRAFGHDGRRRAGSRTRALSTSPLRRTHGCPQHGTHGEHPAWSMIPNGIRDANRCQRPLGDDRWLVARRLRPPARVAVRHRKPDRSAHRRGPSWPIVGWPHAPAPPSGEREGDRPQEMKRPPSVTHHRSVAPHGSSAAAGCRPRSPMRVSRIAPR